MQHDYLHKNVLTFDPTPGAEGVYKERMCACMMLYAPFLFNLMCNITTFIKNKIVLTSVPTSGVEGVLRQNMCLRVAVLHSRFH